MYRVPLVVRLVNPATDGGRGLYPYPPPREQGPPSGTAHGLAVVLLEGDAGAGQLVKVRRNDLLQVQVQRHQQGVSSTWLCQEMSLKPRSSATMTTMLGGWPLEQASSREAHRETTLLMTLSY